MRLGSVTCDVQRCANSVASLQSGTCSMMVTLNPDAFSLFGSTHLHSRTGRACVRGVRSVVQRMMLTWRVAVPSL